ncbi:MAG TPA: hypothetical protein VMG08_08580 [Allosphingosinicella sp.]|nr:hypothetical protein [Allosphingosinicella sp.]
MRGKLALAVIAATLLTAHPASAFDYREAAYRTYMYSDASHTTVVGTIEPTCGYFYVQYYLSGTYTCHQQDEFVGYCTQYGWEPL